MPSDLHESQVHDPDVPSPAALELLSAPLSRAAKVHLQGIATVIGQIAPAPGRIVYLHTVNLSTRLSGLQAVMFSAVDVTTHVQVAQIHLARTSAAALSFVDFVIQGFPFPISEMRTLCEAPFHHPHDHPHGRNVSALMGQRGVVHSFVQNPLSDVLFSITSKLTFGYEKDGLGSPHSPFALQQALNQFLFFHNNFRFVPWLEGKTPVQKLRTFRHFHNIHSFNPPGETVGEVFPEATQGRELKSLQRNLPAPKKSNQD